MATETQTQVLQLYVGILGRGVDGNGDVDQEGFEYWVSELEAGRLSIDDMRRHFIEVSEEGQALYSGTTEEVINQLYQNLFGRPAEQEGLDYWVARVNDGQLSNYQLADALSAAAQGSDTTALQARVAEQAEAVGVADDGGDATGLTAALNTLNGLNEELAETLAAQGLDTDADGEIDVEAEDVATGDVDTAVGAYSDSIDTQLQNIIGSADNEFNNAGDNTKAGLIADAQAQAADDIETAEDDLATAEDGVVNGVLDAITTVQSRAEAYGSAIDAAAAADVAEDAELLKFNALNADDLVVNGNDLELGGTPVVIAQLVNGQWRVDEDADFTTLNADGIDDLVGFDTYLATLQAETDAANAETAAEEALNDAIVEVLQLENDDDTLDETDIDAATVDTSGTDADGNTLVAIDFNPGGATGSTAPDAQNVLTEREDLAAAEETLETLNETVAAFQDLVALKATVDGLEEDIVEAQEAIEDPVDEGGLGITLLDGADNFTVESDVYLFAEDLDSGEVLSGFGVSGEDRIYFGEGYTLVQIPDGDTITDDVGSSSELEILWEQDGNNLKLYVEGETFAGNGSSDSDVTTIELTGFFAEDITSFEGGFLTAGEVA